MKYKKWLIGLTLSCMIFVSCSSMGDPRTAVVRKMYDSLSKGDIDGYMDTMLPANRTSPNPLGILNALSLSLSYGGVGVRLSDLAKFSISNLKLKTLSSTDDYAIVQAEGVFRYSLLMIEIKFCDTHDLRKVNGQWYVDMAAPEKQVRVERILSQKQNSIIAGLSGVSDSDLMGMMSAYFQTLEQVVDLCEH